MMANGWRGFLALAAICAAHVAWGAAPGERYVVDGRCVTVTRVTGSQAWYEWSAGNASGSGNLPASDLTRRCGEPSQRETAPGPAPAVRAPAGAAPAAGNRFALDAAEAKSMVDAHNAVRAQVGVGPLAWDAALGDFAQRYVGTLAKSCDLQHSKDSGFGENLAAWSGNSPPARAITLWAEEKASYRSAGGPFRNADMAAGHYTQVVWRATTHVGCGRTHCSKGGVDWTLVSCNYSPPGNMMGARVY